MSACRISCPSAGFMLRVRLFLLRFTERKYVASPLTKGGQPRVSSPFPGSSILITSAPMSPSDMAQNGPASTRVRSTTRTPASGGRLDVRRAADFGRAADAVLRTRRSVFLATGPPVPQTLDYALADGGDPLAASTRSAPEEARPVGESGVREVEHGVYRFHGHVGADLHALGGGAVTEEPGAPLELHEGQMERGPEALGRRVEGGERDHLP